MQSSRSNSRPIVAICVISFLAYVLVHTQSDGTTPPPSTTQPDIVAQPPAQIKAGDKDAPPAISVPDTPAIPPPVPKVEEPVATDAPTDAPTEAPTKPPAPVAPAFDRPIGNANCPRMKTLARSLLNLPNDIQLLLGILRAYIDDQDTVLELGSRQGSSTGMILESAPRRFATVDLHVTPTVAAMHKYGRECSKASPENYFTVQGDDLEVKIPFENEVDMMFLDTLHASWLLQLEMIKYPPSVKHYMAFHDSFSYTHHDEVYPGVVERRNDKNRHWRGLKVAFDDFLRTHKDEWVEDMSYIHNNGLYVLRRKSFVPTLPQASGETPDFEKDVDADLGAGLLGDHQCRTDIGAMGSAQYYICDQFGMFYRRTSLTDAYTRLLTGNNILARQLPVIFGYAVAVNTYRVTECVTSVLIAALHGARSNDKTLYVSSALTPENCPALKRLRDHASADYGTIRFNDNDRVDLVISKAGVQETFEGRVYTIEYGTSMIASKLAANDAFELHSVLQQKPGIAVWKKKGAMDYNYIKL